jgi:hypothetical protein
MKHKHVLNYMYMYGTTFISDLHTVRSLNTFHFCRHQIFSKFSSSLFCRGFKELIPARFAGIFWINNGLLGKEKEIIKSFSPNLCHSVPTQL